MWQWFRTTEPLGECCYENWNAHKTCVSIGSVVSVWVYKLKSESHNKEMSDAIEIVPKKTSKDSYTLRSKTYIVCTSSS